MRKLLCLLPLLGCSDPTPPERPSVVLPSVVAVEPSGTVARVPRFTIVLSDIVAPRVFLVTGTTTDADVAAFARGRPSASLAARAVPVVTWSEATTTFAQPTRVLDVGTVTLIVLLDRGAPAVSELRVVDGAPIARKVDPGGGATYCLFTEGALPPLPPSVPLAPSGSARVIRRNGVPCFDLALESASGALPPPSIAGVLVEPTPLESAAPEGPEPEPCLDDAASLSPLCARVLDDRLVLVGDVAVPRLVLGTLDGRPIVAPLEPGARVPLLGLLPSSSIDVDLFVRDRRAEWHVKRTIATAKPRRHLVVNEVLSHAPSGSSSQRFVEIANDGRSPAWLSGLLLVDGEERRPLPAAWLAPGELALVVPTGFVDGLAGEVPPAAGTVHLEVDALKLGSAIAIVDEAGSVLSQFPASSSTRTVSRGRRTPTTPDDAPDAFGWDAHGRATPGRPNQLE